ncbi:MAG: transporter substrate-binding domain-containing protein [Deltaproteobacteria bacterium]|nr:transporter substrate-binding domain-containing protein [Deltaproteobacteria bacterium]
MKKIFWSAILLTFLSGLGISGHGRSDAGPFDEIDRTLVVGVDPIPPFAIKNEEGQWHGVSWAIWHLAATRLGWKYEIKRLTLAEIIPSLLSGEIDVAATGYGITSEREAKIDFSVPYYHAAFGMATMRPKGIHAWAAMLEEIFSISILKPLLALIAVLIFVATLFWLCERRTSKEKKELGFLKGVWGALMLSSETMTTVGYGDDVPKTHLGRLVVYVWMFVSVILLTYFMASVTSSFTAVRLQEARYDLEDLQHIRVGCLAPPSRSALYLTKHRIKHRSFDSVQDALKALSESKIDAVVYDHATLHYLVEKYYKAELVVLRRTFHPKFFGLPLAPDSPLRRPLNKAILEVMQTEIWRHILISYIGNDRVPSSLPFVEKDNVKKGI